MPESVALGRTAPWAAARALARAARARVSAAGLMPPCAERPAWLLVGLAAAWPLAGAGVWASVLGSLAQGAWYVGLSLAIWAAAWGGLARLLAAARGTKPGREGLAPAIAIAALTGLALGALLLALGYAAGASAAPATVLALVGSALALAIGFVALVVSVALVADAVRGSSARPLDRLRSGPRVPRRLLAAALAGVLAGCAWLLARACLGALFPEAALRAWLYWLVSGAGAALLLRLAAALGGAFGSAPARVSGARRAPATPAALGAAIAYAGALVLALGLRAPWAGAGLDGAPARSLAAARSTLGQGRWDRARAQARAAAAAALAQGAYRLAAAGQGAQAATLTTAALAADPTNVPALTVEGLDALAEGAPQAAAAAAATLLRLGHPAQGYPLASLACAALAAPARPIPGASRCAASAAVEAAWWRPMWALNGLPAPSARTGRAGALPLSGIWPTAAWSAAVGAWAAAIRGPLRVPSANDIRATNALVGASAQAMAEAEAALAELSPGGPTPALGLALAEASAGAFDGGAVSQGLALAGLDSARTISPATARQALQVGELWQVAGPAIGGGAQSTPLPAPLAAAAIALAERPGAPPALTRSAGLYCLLVGGAPCGRYANGYTGAVALWSAYLRARPRDAVTWADLAAARYELRQFPEAVADARRALAEGSGAAAAQADIIAGDATFGQAEGETADPTRERATLVTARAYLDRGVRLYPYGFLNWMALGYIDLDLKEPRRAVRLFRTALSWHAYDLGHHVDTFSAPGEGLGFTGMPGTGLGSRALASAIQIARQEESAVGQ